MTVDCQCIGCIYITIYSLVGWEPSIISLEATSVIEVLPLLPAVVCVDLVAPGLALSLLVRELLIVHFIVVVI